MEFSKETYNKIARNFCDSYNLLNKSNFKFLDVDFGGNNYDFRIADGKNTLKIQCKSAIAEELEDFKNLQNMLTGKKYSNKKSYRLIHDSDRFKYSIDNILVSDKKRFAYTDCILLIVFIQFPFGGGSNDEYYLSEMKKNCNNFKNNFLEVWIANESGHSGEYNRCFKIM